MEKKSLLCALASVALCPALALSADLQPDSVINLETVEVVSNRASAKQPVAFSNLTREEIARQNTGVDLPYLLQQMPSLVTTSDAGAGVGYTSLSIRGVDASRINVTANGIPVNDAESHNVYWVNIPDLASSLRDVQVQRGVGLSTNGAGAFGATINMLTDTPADNPYGFFSGSYGTYNTYKATARVGTGLVRDHWSLDARISRIASDGYIERATSSLWSYFGQLAYRNRGTSLRLLTFGGKERTYMAWDYASLEEMEKYGRRYNPCGKYLDSNGQTAYYPDQYDNYSQYHYQLHLAQTLGDYFRLNAALHYTRGGGYYEQYKTGRTLVEYGLEPFQNSYGETIKKSDLVRLKNMLNDFYGATLAATYTRGRLDAVVGGGIHNFRGDHYGQVAWVRNYIGPIDPLQEYYRNVGRKLDMNIYARANVALGAGFSAYADLQYRHINYNITGIGDNYDWNNNAPQRLDIHRRYDFFNPKAGLTWQGKHQRAYLSWSVAHKEPVRDNFVDSDPRHMPHPERMMDYEAGYSWWTGIITLGANVYFMDYDNQLVVTGQLSDTGNPLSVNVPKSYRLGVELQGALKPCRWFTWEINATLSRNRIKNFVEHIYEDEWTNPIWHDLGSTPLAMSPDVVLHNSFDFTWRGARATLVSRYVSKRYLTNAGNDQQSIDPYFVTDLHLSYTFSRIAALNSLSAGLVVYNLFNAKYFDTGYAGQGYYRDNNGQPVIYRYAGYAAQAPTHVMATLSFNF